MQMIVACLLQMALIQILVRTKLHNTPGGTVYHRTVTFCVDAAHFQFVFSELKSLSECTIACVMFLKN